METDRTGYRRILAFLDRYKPNVSKLFSNAISDLDGVMELDEMRLRSIGKICAAGEYVYFDPAQIARAADERGELAIFAELIWELSQLHHHFAHLLVMAWPAGRWRLAQTHAQIAETAAALLPSGKYGATLFRILLESNDAAELSRRAENCRTLCRHARAIIPDVATLLSEKRAILPADILDRWLSRGASLAESGRNEEAGAFLRFQSRESRALLGLQYAVLSDLRNVLSIYAASVASRTLRIGDLESNPFAGDRPFTDGQGLYLPGRLRLFPNQKTNERAYTLLAALNAGLIRFGTFAFRLESISELTEIREQFGTLLPDVMETLRRRYRGTQLRLHERISGEVELHHPGGRSLELLCTPHEEFAFLFPTPDFAGELWSYIEIRRIASCLSARYPGFSDDLRLWQTQIFPRRKSRMKSLIEAAEGSLFREFEALIEGVIEEGMVGTWHTRGDNRRLDTRITTAAARIRSSISRAGSPEASANLTYELYRDWFEQYPLVPIFADRRAHTFFSGIGLGVVNAAMTYGASPELFALRSDRTQYDYEFEENVEREVDLTSLSHREAELDGVREALIHGSIRSTRYPEFDLEIGGYRTGWCTLHESVLESGDPLHYTEILKTQDLVFRRMRKRFLYMQPEERSRTRRWLDGNDINLSDAIDLSTDIMRGAGGDEKIYERVRQNRRDIVAAILVDASSSTEEMIGGKRVIDIEKEALSILSSALNTVGDVFGVYSFFSMGRSNVFCSVIKELSEGWGAVQQSRIGSMKTHAGNRDGCAIRHITRKLLEWPSRTKLLLLLSDGIPADAGYGSRRGRETGEYAIADTRRAIDEARQSGITPYCITVDRFARNYIPRLYGHHYAIIDDVSRLPERLSKIYARLTA